MLSGLIPLCRELGPELIGPDGASDEDKAAFLLGLSGQETDWGDRSDAGRHEQAYARGGYYWNTSPDQKRLVAAYEDLAAISWGPTQILPVVAYEVGFRGHPCELRDPRVCYRWTVKVLNEKRLTMMVGNTLDGFHETPRLGMTFEKLYRSWNGGVGAIDDPPPRVIDYGKSQMKNFEQAKITLAMNRHLPEVT